MTMISSKVHSFLNSVCTILVQFGGTFTKLFKLTSAERFGESAIKTEDRADTVLKTNEL